jgi:hypothetical protein
MQPPLLPEEVLSRVLRVARVDGVGVLTFATFFALTSAGVRDVPGAVVWLLVAGAGALALHGLSRLQEYDARGLSWIVAGQYLFLAVALAHCAFRLGHYDPTSLREAVTEEMKATLAQANYDEEEFLHTVYVTTYLVIAVAVFLFKGSLAIYFQRRRPAIVSALETAD